jgi:pimeloyl-ACP methyl ester carboxylesterase
VALPWPSVVAASAESSAPMILDPTGRAPTADGIEIAYYDLGGTGPTLLLVHATGFCAAVLAPLATRLGDHFHCIALDARAHGQSERPPGDDFGWYGFAADVHAVVDHLGLDSPVGVGHSCGGAALLLAEQTRPGTFSSLYCYEPIVYTGDEPLVPAADGNPLAAGALRRRDLFASRPEALANFSSKAPFDHLDADVLTAYIDNAFRPTPDGLRLRCRPADEALVYAHALAHDAFAGLRRVSCPVTLVCGSETDAMGPGALRRMAGRLPHSRVEVMSGLGHFGPLEDPRGLARSVEAAAVRGGSTPGA